MARIVYITHPQVAVDPDLDVRRWSLSDTGRARATAMLDQPWVATISRVVASDETKAIETAEILAEHLGLVVEVRDGVGEMDRSATGFLPPDVFEVVADAFFASPHESVRGWERAIDAQHRMVAGLGDLLTSNEDVAVVGHGGVGTLWYCHLAGQPIARRFDQPGQGHYITIDTVSSAPLHHWLPIDRIG